MSSIKKKPRKDRIDRLLFERGLAPSRERAQAFLMAGKVVVNGNKVEKPGVKVNIESEIQVLGEDQPYVSRGGLKLEKGIEHFRIPVKNRIAMDVGASTGGFTDCLLQKGANYVFAIDVGYGQLDWKLVSNPRVKNLERSHFLKLPFSTIGTFVDLIVIDVSFISLEKVLEKCLQFLAKDGSLIALIKPQFEAGKELVNKGGVVKDDQVRQEVIKEVIRHAKQLGYSVLEHIESPIKGKKSGNIEYLLHLKKSSDT